MTAAAPAGPRRGAARAAVGIGALTALSRLAGLGRVAVVAAVLGTTYLGNAFQSANSVSNVLFELLAAGALAAVLVPTFVGLVDDGQRQRADELAGRLLAVALVALGAVAVLGVVAAPLVARVLTVGVPEAVADDQRRLVTFLLLFFVPQLVLYGWGTVATGLLHATGRFRIVAIAPMANTVVVVAALVAFRSAAGPSPSLELGLGERLLLVLAGTGGVVGFVGVLVVGARAAGWSVRPRDPRHDPDVHALLAHAGWGIVLHSAAGILLAAALVGAGGVEGGVVAYQLGWVVFQAPFAVFAQPLVVAVAPDLVRDARAGRDQVFATLRWAVRRMVAVVGPVSVAVAAAVFPARTLLALGEVTADGADLVAAAVATLAVGLVPYSVFLLLARASYALGDSRTPGVIAVVSALGGGVVGLTGALQSAGAARVAWLGGGHTVAYVLAACWLALVLRGGDRGRR